MPYGIDCGSKFLKIVKTNTHGECVFSTYVEHCGDPLKIVSNITLKDQVALTGWHASLLGNLAMEFPHIDEIAAVIAVLQHLHLQFRKVVCVGASTISIIGLDDDMQFESYRQNSLCAAGTGSFVDEQMHRLGFTYDGIALLPIEQNPPTIATRCAVFAKSDVIHRQQEGYGHADLWSGLCRGVSMTMLQSVFRGQLPNEEVLFIGGIFLNPAIRFWTSHLFPLARFHNEGHLFAAWGCALLSNSESSKFSYGCVQKGSSEISKKKLEIHHSKPHRDESIESYEMDGCEIRLHKRHNVCADAVLGIDIGSTSTKLAMIDAHTCEVIADVYTKTQGNPIGATAKLFEVLKQSFKKMPQIWACATTGSGRKLVGELVGADVIINEITAHYVGARHVDNAVETIFEIGGQDSKYIRASQGMVVDCNMNFVCAAGTGSFIEEQANRLGFRVSEIGDKVIGLLAPAASDRCTVFMEQDINSLLREGNSKEEVLAAVIVAIAKNYLNRVVGTRPVTGDKIFFQGATARNKALVAAFEMLTEKPIVVPPHCHVMGSFGAALLARERTKGASRFRGFDSLLVMPDLTRIQCDDCTNRCSLTYVNFPNGEKISWGHLCGKEDHNRIHKRGRSYFKQILDAMHAKHSLVGTSSKPRAKVGIPLMLSMFSYLPLWHNFLTRLNFDIVVSNGTQSALREMAVKIARTDFCFPVKLALAHFEQLAQNDDVDIIFCPTLVSERRQKNGMPRVFCPYVISIASIASSLDLGKPIIMPTIDFRDDQKAIIDELHKTFAPYGINKNEILDAFENSLKDLNEYRASQRAKGIEALNDAYSQNKKVVVFIGRPYNLYDALLNLNLPRRFAHYGVDVHPFEMIADDSEDEIPHMYWNYGELILRTAKKIRNMQHVYPVYLTNFSCGPDSFVLTRFESIMEGKPYLIIELDEHGSETGYITRIEAFLDIILERSINKRAVYSERSPFVGQWNKKTKTLWIPSMHHIGARLFAAGFRAWGFKAEALPPEDVSAGELGKRTIRGSECLPAAATIGAFLKKMREINANPATQALFMPTAEGPCRFGQYAVLHRKILDREGFSETMIFAPTSVNSYMGMPASLRQYLWDIILASDMLLKAILKVRPYELHKGKTDALVEDIVQHLERRIEHRADVIKETLHAVSAIFSVPHLPASRPLVGVVGEIYVRCNSFCNDNLIRVIENCGGEAWLAPISEWVLYTSWLENYATQRRSKNPLKKAIAHLKHSYLYNRAHEFENAFRSLLDDRLEPPIEEILHEGMKYLPLRFEGEAILTIGRSCKFFQQGASLVVNCAPFGCMPGNITTAIFSSIQQEYQKPVLSLFYDGETSVNRAVEIYLRNMTNTQKDARANKQKVQLFS